MGFEAAITNLGKYNEGELDYVWIEFPASAAEVEKAMRDVGIGDLDAFGIPYEEMFVSDYSCDDGYALYAVLGEYPSIDRLNAAAEIIDELNDLDEEGLREYCEEHGIEFDDEFERAIAVDDAAIVEMIQERLEDGGLPGLIDFLAPCVKARECEYVCVDGAGRLVPIEDVALSLGELRNQVFMSAMDCA